MSGKIFLVTINDVPVRAFKHHRDAEHFMLKQPTAAGVQVKPIDYSAKWEGEQN